MRGMEKEADSTRDVCIHRTQVLYYAAMRACVGKKTERLREGGNEKEKIQSIDRLYRYAYTYLRAVDLGCSDSL